MTRFVRTGTLAALLMVSVLCTQARAASITLAPDSISTFDVAWSLLVGGEEVSAVATFVVAVTDSATTLGIKLTNTTDPALNERIVSLGFNIDPDPTGVFGGSTMSLFGPVTAGSSALFGIIALGDYSAGATLDSFTVKFKGDLGTYSVAGALPGTTTVPEYESSASFLLIGLGFVAAFGGWRRLTVGSTAS